MHIIFSPITMLKSIKNCLYKYCTLYRITFCNILILNSSSHVHEERNGKQRRSLNEAQVARAVHVACGALRSSSRKWQEQCQHGARQRRLLCKRCVRAGNTVEGERENGGTGESGTRNVRRKREGHKVAGKRQFKSRRKIKYIRS